VSYYSAVSVSAQDHGQGGFVRQVARILYLVSSRFAFLLSILHHGHHGHMHIIINISHRRMAATSTSVDPPLTHRPVLVFQGKGEGTGMLEWRICNIQYGAHGGFCILHAV
jgi:hypothetical protein